MKHAFLIIAHNKFNQLQLLLNLLDDERNDVYVHIDKKVKDLPHLYTKFAGLNILKNRIDVRWGDVSQIETELLLFETALNNGNYSCFHLISGVDLPIKTNNYIHEFIDKHPNTEFVGFCPTTPQLIKNRFCKYHLFTKHYQSNNIIMHYIYFFLRSIIEPIFNLFYKRVSTFELKKGAQWVSITQNFCKYIVNKKTEIIKRCQNTCCCDEIVLQTLLWNSPYKENIYNINDEYKGCLRLIDWKRGNPYIFGKDFQSDKEMIESSDSLFARKFDMDKYPEIVSFIIKKLQNNNK